MFRAEKHRVCPPEQVICPPSQLIDGEEHPAEVNSFYVVRFLYYQDRAGRSRMSDKHTLLGSKSRTYHPYSSRLEMSRFMGSTSCSTELAENSALFLLEIVKDWSEIEK